MKTYAQRLAETRRDTEPRRVISAVSFEHAAAQHHVAAGTVVHCLPGSEMEKLLGGPSNLDPLAAHHRPGASN